MFAEDGRADCSRKVLRDRGEADAVDPHGRSPCEVVVCGIGGVRVIPLGTQATSCLMLISCTSSVKRYITLPTLLAPW